MRESRKRNWQWLETNWKRGESLNVKGKRVSDLPRWTRRFRLLVSNNIYLTTCVLASVLLTLCQFCMDRCLNVGRNRWCHICLNKCPRWGYTLLCITKINVRLILCRGQVRTFSLNTVKEQSCRFKKTFQEISLEHIRDGGGSFFEATLSQMREVVSGGRCFCFLWVWFHLFGITKMLEDASESTNRTVCLPTAPSDLWM